MSLAWPGLLGAGFLGGVAVWLAWDAMWTRGIGGTLHLAVTFVCLPGLLLIAACWCRSPQFSGSQGHEVAELRLERCILTVV